VCPANITEKEEIVDDHSCFHTPLSLAKLERQFSPVKMSENYHCEELRIALDRSNPANILPPPVPESHLILDVGCGAGQTLLASYPGRIAYGVDVDIDALRMGRTLTSLVQFTCARAEMLPYASKQFDMVLARVSLPYTDLRRSLIEIRRVLRPSGVVWMTLHPFSFTWKELKPRHYRSWLFFAYTVINSLTFAVFHKHFSLFGRYNSFQTRGGMRRALRKQGFTDIEIQTGRHFQVTARVPAQAEP